MASDSTIRYRVNAGWDDDDILNRPKGCHKWRWDAERRLGYPVERAIREMRAEGHTWAFIGVQLGASRETVRSIGNG